MAVFTPSHSIWDPYFDAVALHSAREPVLAVVKVRDHHQPRSNCAARELKAELCVTDSSLCETLYPVEVAEEP